tara:strand:- start:1487 stop:1702 length:216 start_codon:yes stop_codon:yes gene_type:complete
MSIRTQLRSLKRSLRGRRWTVRENKNGYITEIKMIFNPEEYTKHKNSKPMYADKALLKLLDKDYEKKKNNS